MSASSLAILLEFNKGKPESTPSSVKILTCKVYSGLFLK